MTAAVSRSNLSDPEERGAIMLEAAIGFPLFLLIFGGGIELIRFCFYVIGLQLVVTNGVRASSIGNCGTGVVNCIPTVSAEHVKARILSEAAAVGIGLSPESVCIRAESNLDCTQGQDTTGKSKELVVVRVSRPFFFFFGLGELTVRAAALARNEPRHHGAV